MQALTVAEHERFEQCKHTIKDGLKTAFEVGAALVEIRDSKLYRSTFKTFAEFCQDEFKLGKSHAYRLIDAANVSTAKPLSPKWDKNQRNTLELNATDSELQRIAPDKRPEVLAKAKEAGEVTAASIAKAAADCHVELLPPKPVIELDAAGFPIPAKLVSLWQRRPEVQKVLTALSTVRTALRAAQEQHDPLWQPITMFGENWNTLLKSLDQAYASCGQAMPYVVCTDCQGLVTDRCGTCHGRGMLSEFFYKTHVGAADRKMRESLCKKAP